MKVTRVALHIAAAATLSTSVAASQLACDSVEQPTSDVSMSKARPQGTSHAAPDQRLPDSRSPDVLIPDATTVVPAEFNFNITLTLRPNSRHQRIIACDGGALDSPLASSVRFTSPNPYTALAEWNVGRVAPRPSGFGPLSSWR